MEQTNALTKALLTCGLLSSLFYIVLNIVVPMQWVEYDSLSQTVSELSAIGAPTRNLWILLCAPYTALATAFGWGVLRAAGQNRLLKVAGLLLTVYGALGVAWYFAPMHLRSTLAAGGGTLSDTFHIVLAIVTQILFFTAMAFAATALNRSFKIFTLVTVLLLALFGALTFIEAPGVAANLPTPLIGVWERINIGLFLLWVSVFSLSLIRRGR